MFKPVFAIQLMVAIAVDGACTERLAAQVAGSPAVSCEAVAVNCACRKLALPAADTQAGVPEGVERVPSLWNPLPAVTGFPAEERFGLWLTAVLLAPWMLSSLIQCVMRTGSLVLQSLLLLGWMAAVTLSAWSFWGGSLPVAAWTALCVPVLGGALPYLAFVAGQLVPLRLDAAE